MKEVFKSDRIKLKYDYKKFDFQKAVIKNLISLGIIKKKDFVEINNDLSSYMKSFLTGKKTWTNMN